MTDQDNQRIVGSDGELIVPVAVPEGGRSRHPRKRQTWPVVLMVALVVLIFGGAVLAVVLIRTGSAESDSGEPSVGRIPARYAYGPYAIGVQFAYSAEDLTIALPCLSRQLEAVVGGTDTLTARLWTPDGGVDVQNTLYPDSRSVTFDLSPEPDDKLNLSLYDLQGNEVTSFVDIYFGEPALPFCTLKVIFEPM